MIEAYTLFSGSSGNSLLIKSGSSAVLMDAGRSRKAVLAGLSEAGVSPSDLAAVFVTHEHTDHISALAQLVKHEHLPIHAASRTAGYLSELLPDSAVEIHPPLYTVQVGSLTVTSFPLPHDSLCHVGYRFEDGDGDAFCAATDMGHVTDEVKAALCGCRGALLESNHDVEMLRFGPYPAILKSRILSPRGHLSNEDCASLALYAAMQGVTHIGLGHLSAENNTPELALAAAERALSGSPVSSLTVCARANVTRIL